MQLEFSSAIRKLTAIRTVIETALVTSRRQLALCVGGISRAPEIPIWLVRCGCLLKQMESVVRMHSRSFGTVRSHTFLILLISQADVHCVVLWRPVPIQRRVFAASICCFLSA